MSKKLVLGRYEVSTGKKGMLGEGSFSVVQKGVDKNSGKTVAVKTYKMEQLGKNKEEMENNIKKFKRQIEVLKMLMEPIKKEQVQDSNLHHELLFSIDPKKCFLELIDYSKEKNGEPGPDTSDGKMYVVTEVADYSLKDYLAARHDENKAMSAEAVKQISKSFLVAMALLHAKGLVHLDMKPENIMRAGTTWKVIDVDGCTPINKKISINDSTISFSPCYCAPEWANFLIEDGDFLKVGDVLDVWSVGISLCELIMLDAVLKPKYVSIYRNCGSHRKAGFLFLEWLANPREGLALDKKIQSYDGKFTDMVLKRMLTKKPSERCHLADCLKHEYLKDTVVPGLENDSKEESEHTGGHMADKLKELRANRFAEEPTNRPPIMKGTLFKLNADGDKQNAQHWLRRDMWLAANGNLCYFSQKSQKRLVILDVKHFACSKLTVEPKGTACHEHCFSVEIGTLTDDADAKALEDKEGLERQYYACDNAEDLAQWCKGLNTIINDPGKYMNADTKVNADKDLATEFREFRIMVRNRRDKIDRTTQSQYQPVFERELWKLNSEGDPMKEEDWTQRKMWLAKNGAFCYFSKKENKELMYYRPDDIRYVKYRKLEPNESVRPFSFELTLKPADGAEYAPGIFAAENEEVMQIFLGCVEKYQRIKGAKK